MSFIWNKKLSNLKDNMSVLQTDQLDMVSRDPYEFSYPNNKKIRVTEETTRVTDYTFPLNGYIEEFESINYFFNLMPKDRRVTVLDLGAQSGLYTLYSKFFSNLDYHAFEPYNLSYKCLIDNLALNSINNVKCNNIALGDIKREQILRVPDHKGLNTLGNTPLRFDTFEEIKVEVDTLDNLFYDKDIPVDFIKCDTEGYEYFIIKGGEKTLNKYHPELFLEVNETNCKQCGVTKEILLDLLSSMNYEIVNIKQNENYHFKYNAYKLS